MHQQGSPPHRPGRMPIPTRRRGHRDGGRYPWDDVPDDSGEYPPWAGPQVHPRWADHEERDRRLRGQPGGGADDGPRTTRFVGDHRPRPGFRSRFAEARARRNRLMLYIWGGAVVAVAVIATVVVLHLGGHPPAKPASNGFVNSFQPGEFKTVPRACSSVTTTTLNTYLAGKRTSFAPLPLDGRAESVCDWTLDAPPVYRTLQLTVQAYAPSGLAPGNGSATSAANAVYQQALQQKLKPPRATHLPRATVTPLRGFGGAAFAALQVVRTRGDTTDLETVVVRDRNVVITAVLEGAQSSSGRYGPVSLPLLRGGAIAVAHDMLFRLG